MRIRNLTDPRLLNESVYIIYIMCIPTLRFPMDFWSRGIRHMSALITEAIMTLINSEKEEKKLLMKAVIA